MARRNPFKPTFGATPPLLVGRDDLLADFTDALAEGPGAAGRATLYTGARGAGKTVMLNEVEDAAREQDWVVVSETATEGLVRRLTESRLPELLRRFDPEAVRRRLQGVSLGRASLSWETLEAHVIRLDLRAQISMLADLLAENEAGLLITLDEVHQNQIAELREVATTIQHAFREEREVAFAAAGLSSAISDVLQDEVLTFLRRAERHHLGVVELDEVRRALAEPIRAAGREVADDALEVMVEATGGYPFLIQLVGSHCWKAAVSTDPIGLEDARQGVASARRRLGSLVHAPALRHASAVDKSFLLAMCQDEGPSRLADIAERMGTSVKYASVYRQRLIEAELIVAAGRGYVDFALPYLREYLREHAASGI